MSPLTLRLREPPSQRCDLSRLVPAALTGSARELEQVEIGTTKRRLCVADVFDVIPGAADHIRIEGGSERFDRLGAGLEFGCIEVLGDLGQQAGRGMKGGEIFVRGNLGRLAGSGMRGGRIVATGDAGDLVGGPLPGEPAGMNGGVIHVKGSVGGRAGDRMRRGLIAVGGDLGTYPGSRLIGGTIVGFGRAGDWPGYLMARGTLIFPGGCGSVSPTFLDTGVHELVAMRLIAKWLIAEGIEGSSILAGGMRRLMGDTATLGKGELFLPAAQ